MTNAVELVQAARDAVDASEAPTDAEVVSYRLANAVEAVLKVIDRWDTETNEPTQGALVDAIRKALGVSDHANGSTT